ITQDTSALINAQIVDASLQPVYVVQNVLAPSHNEYFSPRFDYAVTPNFTLQGRYNWNHNTSENGGVGQFPLLSRSTNFENTNHNFNFTETQVIGTRLINESRFSYNHNRNTQTGNGSSPAINVLSSFNGGGSNVFNNYNDNHNFEFQNNTSYTRGRHLVRFG